MNILNLVIKKTINKEKESDFNEKLRIEIENHLYN